MHNPSIGGIKDAFVESPLSSVKLMAVNTIRFWLAPYAWTIPSEVARGEWNIYQMLMPGMLMWYILIPAVLYGIVSCMGKKSIQTFLLYAFLFLSTFFYAFVSRATTVRWNAQLMPIALIFAAIGFVNFSKWKIYLVPYLTAFMAMICMHLLGVSYTLKLLTIAVISIIILLLLFALIKRHNNIKQHNNI